MMTKKQSIRLIIISLSMQGCSIIWGIYDIYIGRYVWGSIFIIVNLVGVALNIWSSKGIGKYYKKLEVLEAIRKERLAEFDEMTKKIFIHGVDPYEREKDKESEQ